MSFKPIEKTPELAKFFLTGQSNYSVLFSLSLGSVDFFPFHLLTLLRFRKFQNCRPRIRFEKYKLHFSPTLGKPLRDHSKVWGHGVPLSMEGVRKLVLYAGESCFHKASLYPAGFTFTILYLCGHLCIFGPMASYPKCLLKCTQMPTSACKSLLYLCVQSRSDL